MAKYLYLFQVREKDFLAALISFRQKCLSISSVPVTIPVKNFKKYKVNYLIQTEFN